MELNKAIQKRYSVRKFKDKKPSWKTIIECMDSVRYTPMAGNNFTLKLILVNDSKKIQKIAEACQQPFVGQAKYIAVVCSDSTRPKNAYEKRGETFTRQQAGAAIQNFLLKIQEKGLATCWVGDFVDEMVKRAVSVPEKVNVEAIFPIGYEYSKTKPRSKIEIDKILYFNEYNNKKMKKPKKLNV